MKKFIAAVLSFVLILCCVQMPVQAAWQQKGNAWYYTDSAGKIATGWVKHGNNWYYMNNSGVMQTGWLQLGSNWYYLGESGAMVTGTVNINGKLHQFNTSGLWLGEVKQTGWVKDGNVWCYFQNGVKATGWVKVSNVWYYMNANGAMQTGWLKQGNLWYYLNNSGAMVTGTVSINGKQHRFNASGVWLGETQQSGWVKSGSSWYYYRNGAKVSGWLLLGSTWYYMNPTGIMQTGWIKYNNAWYYMSTSGAMQTGWFKDGNTWYYADTSGVMQTGWLQLGNLRYYLSDSGAMQVGWQTIGADTYYFYESGAMAVNTTIDNITIGVDGKAQKSEPLPEDTEDPAAPPANATITIGIPQKGTYTDYENNELTLWLEEETGYEIDIIPYSDPHHDFGLDMAYGQPVPDILLGFRMSDSTIDLLGSNAYLADLTSYFRDTDGASRIFWERLQTCLDQNEIDQVMQKIYCPDADGIYCVPTITTNAFNTDSIAWINTTWLHTLNLQMPTNAEELYQVLKAFKTQDPNGNGIADEIPLMGLEQVSGFRTTEWLINMYLYYDNSNLWQPDANGQLQSVFTQDAYRDALKFIHKLTEEGLLHPAVYTYRLQEMDALLNAQTPMVGVMVCNMSTLAQRNISHNNLNMYMPIANWGYTPENDLNCQTDTFITGTCADVSAAFRVLMALYSEEGTLRMRYGTPGKDWTDESVYGDSLDGIKANIRILNELPSEANAVWWGFQACGIMDYAGGAARVYESSGEEGFWLYTNIMYAAKYLILDTYANTPKNICRGLNRDSVSDIMIPIERHVDMARSQFAIGELDPNDDAVWNQYLQQLDELGLEDATDAVQTIYDHRDICIGERHLFANAICVDPQTCIYCGIQQGKPKGHDYTGSACSRCHQDTPSLTGCKWGGLRRTENQYAKSRFTFDADGSCTFSISYCDIITGINDEFILNADWCWVDGALCFQVPSGTYRPGTYTVNGDKVTIICPDMRIELTKQSIDTYTVTYADSYYFPIGMVLSAE